MEETGIIRRLDALGRIVIPREFRKLHRIEVGDPLEMRSNAEGDIVIRKVDLSAQLKTVGAIAFAALLPHIDKPVAVCSADAWLAFSRGGAPAGCAVSDALTAAVQSATPITMPTEETGISMRYRLASVYPVCGETGTFGALVLFTDAEPSQTEDALLSTAALFVGKSLQRF